ncbi:lipoma HMGIC fusion partner-like 2 protein [Limulus polyphemus]|uniref:Lipoma HMGIC fusion partner-like 2 protein n=1 Tax=Limulus polyphemus TaxID=6850 RepID=A0ABM1TG34_LIMPO|nr:lipoma HMGIC fusion partner-like 2 protein [Limulus polyphemus]
MCYVIVTSRTLLWTLLTIATFLAMVAAVITPSWLIGSPRKPGLRSRFQTDMNKGEMYSPTLGIYNRCTKLHKVDQLFTDSCAPFVTSFGMPSNEFPNFWKAALVFFAFGIALIVLTVFTSVLGCCIRSIVKKSIFTISGTIQAIAGLLFILGLVLYPAGWGSTRVQLVCGENSHPFLLGDCRLGWAFYLAIGSTIMTCVCSVLSIQAEVSTSSDKVQDEILEGKNLICVL